MLIRKIMLFLYYKPVTIIRLENSLQGRINFIGRPAADKKN
jgi:hypothetical protein